MGNCSPSVIQDSGSTLHGFYQEVLKCPSKHWLALYQTAECTNCNSRNILQTAHISCTICSYSLCRNCFTRKFAKWQKSVKTLPVQDAAEMNKKLLEELKNIVENYCSQKEEQGSQRLQRYLQQQAYQHSKIRVTNDPINLEQSLEIRINTLAKLCLKAYQSRLPVAI